ncbi:MAG TPA: M67 family metallopeptidase, partial [Chthonomonadales bacterium]|nr:M67 family metallopeptidase [Chthonomonadales bacterium]
CGALLGLHGNDGWRVTEAVPARNVRGEASATTYAIAADELVGIDREARRLGLEIAGFYHSHPDHAAQWSSTDFAEAHWVGCCYVIVSVRGGRAAETRAFLLAGTREVDKRFEEVAIHMDL